MGSKENCPPGWTNPTPKPTPAPEATDKECMTKMNKNGCVERGCGWRESTGKCNKGCAKYAKEECPPMRCRVSGRSSETAKAHRG
eukprot:TRINITY_DN3502_c0_g1_i1.p5 TRINITY_DN3502_c0_g1~~TRINITY_DN3502_c0_g1_i1.p5  ORF type:complete len:85 (+),score=27.20 TRINITY_DN3502_c0_g1_i1:326-580(+)